MLQKLIVKNYAIIDHIELALAPDLNIITGETGAGKSIILGALSMVLGQRADSKVIYDESKKCVVEAHFKVADLGLEEFFKEQDLDYEVDSIIRREVSAAGKSRAFVNDTPVTLDVLKELSSYLINVHSQHETLALSGNAFQLQVVDLVAQNSSAREVYQQRYTAYKATEKQLNDLIEQSRNSVGDLDYLQFQFDELEAAELNVEEFDTLETELNTLENAEEIKSSLGAATNLLNYDEGAVLDKLAGALSVLRDVTKYNDEIGQLADRIESSRIELQDIARELEHLADGTEFDPERVAELYQRQNTVNKLLVKHQVQSVQELVDLYNDIADKLRSYESINEDIAKLEKQLNKEKDELIKAAATLTQTRMKAIPGIEKKVKEQLAFVGMADAELKADIQPVAFEKATRSGLDKVTFLFTANKGMKPEELRKVASGGELSRLMLVLKSMIAKYTALPTLIFDEIDTGISGEVAAKVGIVMEQLGKEHQVISITHLPQIASKGQHHLFVHKEKRADRTVTNIRPLSNEERATEIAKMLGGDTLSQAALENARELLQVK